MVGAGSQRDVQIPDQDERGNAERRALFTGL
jgi:hypothetical protein